MTHTRNEIRTAILALSASVAFVNAPVFGQEPVSVAPPPPVSAAPAPAPVILAPPPVSATPQPTVAPRAAPVTRAAPPPAVDERPAPRARTATRTTTTTTRRTSAPARTVAPAPEPAPAPVAEAPVAAPPAAVPAPVAATPPPAPVEQLPVEAPADTGGQGFLIPALIAGGALLLALAAFLFLRRRRRDEEVYEEVYYEEPVVEAAPEPSFSRPEPVVEAAPAVAAAPIAAEAAVAPVETAAAEEVSVEEAHEADVEALAADSAPVAGRPWLEFLMRPVRAGTSQDDAIVQFELTIGNTGSVPAKDVRISTWLVAGGHATDMERMLIEPPADATVSEVDIAAGDGARVEAEITLPKAGIRDETLLPVIVADARYRLPDGSEGRTSASFAIGLPEGEELAGFQLDRATGLLETVEARLHGTPTRI